MIYIIKNSTLIYKWIMNIAVIFMSGQTSATEISINYHLPKTVLVFLYRIRIKLLHPNIKDLKMSKSIINHLNLLKNRSNKN